MYVCPRCKTFAPSYYVDAEFDICIDCFYAAFPPRRPFQSIAQVNREIRQRHETTERRWDRELERHGLQKYDLALRRLAEMFYSGGSQATIARRSHQPDRTMRRWIESALRSIADSGLSVPEKPQFERVQKLIRYANPARLDALYPKPNGASATRQHRRGAKEIPDDDDAYRFN